jgi:hypothetical protein
LLTEQGKENEESIFVNNGVYAVSFDVHDICAKGECFFGFVVASCRTLWLAIQ